MKICSVCKKELIESEFYQINDRVEAWCKNCRKDWAREHAGDPSIIYSWYKKDAKRRGLEFKITFTEFCTFKDIPCYYCGNPMPRIGLDRIDNSMGYLFHNVRSCCKWCNYMKGDHSVEEFLDKCKQILKNLHIL